MNDDDSHGSAPGPADAQVGAVAIEGSTLTAGRIASVDRLRRTVGAVGE